MRYSQSGVSVLNIYVQMHNYTTKRMRTNYFLFLVPKQPLHVHMHVRSYTIGLLEEHRWCSSVMGSDSMNAGKLYMHVLKEYFGGSSVLLLVTYATLFRMKGVS